MGQVLKAIMKNLTATIVLQIIWKICQQGDMKYGKVLNRHDSNPKTYVVQTWIITQLEH